MEPFKPGVRQSGDITSSKYSTLRQGFMESMIDLENALAGKIVKRSERNGCIKTSCSSYDFSIPDITLNQGEPFAVFCQMVPVNHEQERIGIYPDDPGFWESFQEKLGKTASAADKVDNSGMFSRD